VNNACYHNYFELGRVLYFELVLQHAINWDISGFILARTEIDHVEPLFLTDKEVYCFTRVSRLGNKSMTVENAIVAHRNGQPVLSAEGKGILVAMDYRENQSIPIPEAWRKRFAAFDSL
jgi:acyl-CoA thioesterase FadM